MLCWDPPRAFGKAQLLVELLLVEALATTSLIATLSLVAEFCYLNTFLLLMLFSLSTPCGPVGLELGALFSP